MKTRGNLGKSLRLPLLALLLSVLLPFSAVADELTEPWYMIAQLADGQEEKIPMSTVGSLVAVDNAFDFSVLDTNGYVLYDGVMKVQFKSRAELDPTAIRPVVGSQNMLGRAVDDRLTLIGVSGEVAVFDSAGKRQLTTTAKGGETVVSIAHLPAGVYMVKCGRQSFKFTKK